MNGYDAKPPTKVRGNRDRMSPLYQEVRIFEAAL
jgi:hypothetical protein